MSFFNRIIDVIRHHKTLSAAAQGALDALSAANPEIGLAVELLKGATQDAPEIDHEDLEAQAVEKHG